MQSWDWEQQGQRERGKSLLQPGLERGEGGGGEKRLSTDLTQDVLIIRRSGGICRLTVC